MKKKKKKKKNKQNHKQRCKSELNPLCPGVFLSDHAPIVVQSYLVMLQRN